MGCHSAKFQRYERVATDLGIPPEVMMDNVVFSDAKIGDHMRIGMEPQDAKGWFGAAPPDLTLVARVRGNDWLYSYMRSFYVDPTRPYGVNNEVFPNVGMPHVLAPLHSGCARAWQRLAVLVHAQLLCRPGASLRRQQRSVPERGHAACACSAAR